MFIITHTLLPVILTTAGGRCMGSPNRDDMRLGKRELFGIGTAGALPDLLSPHLSLASRYSSFSHTIWFLLAIIPIAFLIARLLFKARPQIVALLMIGAVALHLFCDMIAGGLAWGYPWIDGVIGDYFVPAIFWLPLDIICLVAFWAVLRWCK